MIHFVSSSALPRKWPPREVGDEEWTEGDLFLARDARKYSLFVERRLWAVGRSSECGYSAEPLFKWIANSVDPERVGGGASRAEDEEEEEEEKRIGSPNFGYRSPLRPSEPRLRLIERRIVAILLQS